MKRAGDGGAFGFVMTGTMIIRIANPDEALDRWTVEYHALPWFRGGRGGNRFFGAGTLISDDTLYVYGADEDWSRGAGGRALIVARVPADLILKFTKWKFKTKSGWSGKHVDAERWCEGIGAEYSVSRLPSGRYVLVTTENGLSSKIHARFSKTPFGPWSKPHVLYECPEMKWDKDYFCYAAKAHPEMTDGEELVVTYACNGKNLGVTLRDRRIYRPRFVRIKLDKE